MHSCTVVVHSSTQSTPYTPVVHTATAGHRHRQHILRVLLTSKHPGANVPNDSRWFPIYDLVTSADRLQAFQSKYTITHFAGHGRHRSFVKLMSKTDIPGTQNNVSRSPSALDERKQNDKTNLTREESPSMVTPVSHRNFSTDLQIANILLVQAAKRSGMGNVW